MIKQRLFSAFAALVFAACGGVDGTEQTSAQLEASEVANVRPAVEEAAEVHARIAEEMQRAGASLGTIPSETMSRIRDAETEVSLPLFQCMSAPYGCPGSVNCRGMTACVVTNCGTGRCPTCPASLANLAVNSWCTYDCWGRSGVNSGEAYVFRTFWGNAGPYCF